MISMGNVGRDYRGFFFMNLVLQYDFVPSKRFWAIVHGLLCGSRPKSGVPWPFKSHGVMPLV